MRHEIADGPAHRTLPAPKVACTRAYLFLYLSMGEGLCHTFRSVREFVRAYIHDKSFQTCSHDPARHPVQFSAEAAASPCGCSLRACVGVRGCVCTCKKCRSNAQDGLGKCSVHADYNRLRHCSLELAYKCRGVKCARFRPPPPVDCAPSNAEEILLARPS